MTFLGLFGWPGMPAGEGTPAGQKAKPSPVIIRYGTGWILAGLVPQMLIGPWLFLVLSEITRRNLIDGTDFSSMLFFVSVTAGLFALVFLNASFMAPHVVGLVWGSLISVMITLVLMGVVRYVVFLATLQSEGIPMGAEHV